MSCATLVGFEPMTFHVLTDFLTMVASQFHHSEILHGKYIKSLLRGDVIMTFLESNSFKGHLATVEYNRKAWALEDD